MDILEQLKRWHNVRKALHKRNLATGGKLLRMDTLPKAIEEIEKLRLQVRELSDSLADALDRLEQCNDD